MKMSRPLIQLPVIMTDIIPLFPLSLSLSFPQPAEQAQTHFKATTIVDFDCFKKCLHETNRLLVTYTMYKVGFRRFDLHSPQDLFPHIQQVLKGAIELQFELPTCIYFIYRTFPR